MAPGSDQRVVLGQRIKAARLARLLTQREVAERAGLGRDALAKYETGARGIGVEELVRLAAALRTTVAALLGEEVTSTSNAPETQPPALSPPVDTIVRILTEHPDFTPQVLEMLELLLEREAAEESAQELF